MPTVRKINSASLLKFAGAFLFFLLCFNSGWGGQHTAPPASYQGWKVYGGSPDNIHYSSLRQINRDNVKELKVAWTYDSGDAFPGSEMECNPIIIHGILYATTPKLH